MNEKTVNGKQRKQDRPLIFQKFKSKISKQIPMSAKTAEMLENYVTWAAGCAGADKDEALILTADQAFGEFFKRDKLFLESLDENTNPGISNPSTTSRAPGGGL